MPDQIPDQTLDGGARLRVLLADDHGFIREGLKALVGAQPDMAVVGEAADGAEAVRLAGECAPDVVVMDVSMPRLSGAEATAHLRATCPDVKVLALSMHEDVPYLRGLLEAGASGYVLKRSAPQELIQALRAVAAGGTYLDPAVAARLLPARPAPLRGESTGVALSGREEAVIRLVARGHTNREVADRLGLSVKTAETYRARAMEKLGLTGRAALVRHAAARGWLGGD